MSLPPPRRTTRATPTPAHARTPPRRTRYATPLRASVPMSPSATSASMDVDDATPAPAPMALRPDTVFARSREMTVALHSLLPEEVRGALRNADFANEAYAGEVDEETQYALVATSETCYVWQHTQALTGAPTCYILPCPPDGANAPLHAFVPHLSGREPGLLLLAPSGALRVWDSVADGLAGGAHFHAHALPLAGGETATALARADAQTYVVGTSAGRLLRVSLTSAGGRAHIASRPFSAPRALARFVPFWSGSAEPAPLGRVAALALSGRDAWALGAGRAQRWALGGDGWEELRGAHDLRALLAPALGADDDDEAALEIELLDVQVEHPNAFGDLSSSLNMSASLTRDLSGTGAGAGRSTRLAVLLSHAPPEGEGPARSYAVAHVVVGVDSLEAEKIVRVPYQSMFHAGEAPVHPKLHLVDGGALFVVQFGDAITICSRDNSYADRITLKSAGDRTLGVGASPSSPSQLLLLTAGALLRATLAPHAVIAHAGGAAPVRAVLAQAILYGAHPANPLRFAFAPGTPAAALADGALALSAAVLAGDPELAPGAQGDLTSELGAREERLRFLVEFIAENGALGRLPAETRARLLGDAEKLHAARLLWHAFDASLGAGRGGVLAHALAAFADARGGGGHDPARAFFGAHVGELGRLPGFVQGEAVRAMEGGRVEDAGGVLVEANDVVLTIFEGAFAFRQANAALYGLPTELPVEPWTSADSLLNALHALTDGATTHALASSAPARMDDPLAAQIPRLTAALLSGLSAQQPRRDALLAQTRTEAYAALRRLGAEPAAFALAEAHLDFGGLAALCCTPARGALFPPAQSAHAERIREYMAAWREPFGDALCAWCAEHGELRALFALGMPDMGFARDVDAFFARHADGPRYAGARWVHALGRARWAEAAAGLLAAAPAEGALAARGVMLSLAKLACVVRGQPDDAALAAADEALNAVDTQSWLLEQLQKAGGAGGARAPRALEKGAEQLARAGAARLQGSAGQARVFRALVGRMLRGEALSLEELVDGLTLRDNAGEEDAESYAMAIKFLCAAGDALPEARRTAALEAVWRRVYLRDDWRALDETAGVSDAELRRRFEDTILVRTLRCLLEWGLQHALRAPSAALGVPAPDVLAGRFVGADTGMLEALRQDAEGEVVQVQQVALDCALEERYARALRLAEELLAEKAAAL